jgi:hypothetical protein
MALQLCHNRWRGGADTEAPGFIACRRHDPAFAPTQNGRRNALQARVVALLYGSIDGIHVDVDDLPGRIAHGQQFAR